MPGQTPKDASPWTYFASLKDKRMERCRKHSHQDILVIAICGFICGVDNWADRERWWRFRWGRRSPQRLPCRYGKPRAGTQAGGDTTLLGDVAGEEYARHEGVWTSRSREDESRGRERHAQENMAMMRRLALPC
ncbi:transposase family protein [Archangium primigenium]|uniref:transposase family protein n=1 Tax=[Archangium] primigenium TaxID=2792470 RepID=UPI00195E7351|nr:transposase family protein [Archangium primigenium]